MRKYIAIPLLIIYMLGVTGVMIHAHYCGKTLESWNVYKTSGGCDDDACDDEKDHGCCKDKVVNAKISQDQNSVDFFKLKTPIPVFALPFHFSVPFNTKLVVAAKIFTEHQPNAPPGRWQDIPLYKLHARFTYYG